MVREGIVLGHKISTKGIEVDRDKIEVIEKLPPSTNAKDTQRFLGHVRFYRRFIKISRKSQNHSLTFLYKALHLSLTLSVKRPYLHSNYLRLEATF